MSDFVFDVERPARIGLEEAVFAAGKTAGQVAAIVAHAVEREASLLVTRLDPEKFAALPASQRQALDYCDLSRTAWLGPLRPLRGEGHIAIVAAGTSDLAVVREAERTLRYAGEGATVIADVGVAGIWRLMRRLDEIRAHPVVIAVAGMDAALASVLGGLVGSAVIGVPTSVGYGVAAGGRSALDSMLASCAPGLAVVNIDNGYGAACAALRLIHAAGRLAGA
ncbi:nickel pincer cofactor biosynthesis protein LarB [Methylobacterium sp. JK268]